MSISGDIVEEDSSFVVVNAVERTTVRPAVSFLDRMVDVFDGKTKSINIIYIN